METKSPIIDSWLAEQLRLTAFLSPTAERPSYDLLWKSVVGDDPDKRSDQPKRATATLEGTFGEGRLTLNANPSKIDWIYSSAEFSPTELPNIGLFLSSLNTFDAVATKWFSQNIFTIRLAFGAILVFNVASAKAGYEALSAKLPNLRASLANARDFTYQINRPRLSKSGIQNLEINRLSRWSVMGMRIAHVNFASGDVKPDPSNEKHAVHLELDINTSASFNGELPPDKVPKLFGELLNLGKEIVIKGDIP